MGLCRRNAFSLIVLTMPGRWKLLLLRLLSGCFLTWICLACLAKKQDSQQQLNISTRKPNFSILLDHRKSIVREQCNKLKQQGKLRSSYIVPENFLTVKRYKLTWCPLYKAGSSNWMKNFVVLSGLTIDNSSDLTSLVMNHLTYSYPDTMNNLRNTMKLLIVRDPWDRLLSAYRDKLEVGITPDQQAFQEAYGKDMVARYRREGVERFGEDWYGTNFGSPVQVEGRTLNEPTFWEFVQAIIREGVTDRHWNPYHLHCNLCHVQFDIILKLESLEEEEAELFKFLHADHLLSSQWSNRHSVPLSSSVMGQYYRTLNMEELLKLQEIYKADFTMFQYTQARVFKLRRLGRSKLL